MTSGIYCLTVILKAAGDGKIVAVTNVYGTLCYKQTGTVE